MCLVGMSGGLCLGELFLWRLIFHGKMSRGNVRRKGRGCPRQGKVNVDLYSALS